MLINVSTNKKELIVLFQVEHESNFSLFYYRIHQCNRALGIAACLCVCVVTLNRPIFITYWRCHSCFVAYNCC